MPKGDPARVAKWETRAAEWNRLAGLTDVPEIRATCQGLAGQAERMVEVWRKW